MRMAFRYERPAESDDRPSVMVDVARTELLTANVQIRSHGGETNLHSHNHEDAIWLVLGGRAAFYDENEERVELGPHDGILLPAGSQYWFESVGEEPLEILRVGAKDPRFERSTNGAPAAPERRASHVPVVAIS